MRLMSYRLRTTDVAPRYGVALDDVVIDLPAALPADGLPGKLPTSLLELIKDGSQSAPRMQHIMQAMRRLQDAGPDKGPPGSSHALAEVMFLPPLLNPAKIIAVGRNYSDHVRELGVKQPALPKLFAKYPSNAVGHLADIVRPARTNCLDYEAEVAFVVGRRARNVPPELAMDHIFGYTIVNDLSARDIQFTDEQVTLAKNFRTFAPMGPFLITADAVKDPADLDIRLWLNGRLMQNSNTSNLVFDMRYLLSFISSVMDLEPGDMVLTGTPAGVGYGQDPPRFLQPGDRMRIEVDQLGVLENAVVAEQSLTLGTG
jgi:acylpyruvate hydrolase